MTIVSSSGQQLAARTEPHSEVGRGTVFAFAAYGIWGLFPLYFDALKPAGPWEILAHRILWTLLFCVILLAVLLILAGVRSRLATATA